MKRIFILMLSVLLVTAASAQVKPLLTNTTGTGVETTTVTDTGTGTLSIYNNIGGAQTTAVEFIATKTSGTVAGTVSLLGSLDGTTYGVISSMTTTFTATNVASQGYVFVVTGNPVPYYRVSWTGAGTMVATFKAKLVSVQLR